MKVFCTDFLRLTGGKECESTDGLYLRGDNSLINSGKRVMITSRMRGLWYMPQVVVRIDRAGKGFEARFAGRYYSHLAWGIALADREGLLERQERGLDTALSYAFDGSLAVSDFVEAAFLRQTPAQMLETQGSQQLEEELPPFTLPTEGVIETRIAEVAQLFLLKTGDLLTLPLWQHYREVKPGRQLFVADGDVELLTLGIE